MNQDLLAKVYERVGEMHAKLDTVLEDHKDMKVRVRRLEGQWAKLMGMFAIITLPFTLLYSYFKNRKQS